MRSTVIAFVLVLIAAPCAQAAMKESSLRCSIRSKEGTSMSDLQALVRVSQVRARGTALASLNTMSPATVTKGELEVERGCLVYSFDIQISGRPGIEELIVDPGTGELLEHSHEDATQEAAEGADKPDGGRGH